MLICINRCGPICLFYIYPLTTFLLSIISLLAHTSYKVVHRQWKCITNNNNTIKITPENKQWYEWILIGT